MDQHFTQSGHSKILITIPDFKIWCGQCQKFVSNLSLFNLYKHFEHKKHSLNCSHCGHLLKWTYKNSNLTPNSQYSCSQCKHQYLTCIGRSQCQICLSEFCPLCVTHIVNPLPKPVLPNNQSFVKTDLTFCDDDHELVQSRERYKEDIQDYYCNVCGKVGNCDIGRWICRRCQYDVCPKCRPYNAFVRPISNIEENPFENMQIDREESKTCFKEPSPSDTLFPGRQPREERIAKPIISFELSQFLYPKIAELFVCPICMQIPFPSNAVEHRECGKIFCKKCINRWLSNNTNCQNLPNCPNCKLPLPVLKMQNTKLPISLRNIMSNLKIKCPNNDEMCKWEGELDLLESHLKKCEFTEIFCTWGCDKVIQRKLLSLHFENGCKIPENICKYCLKQIEDKIGHENECEKNTQKIVICPYEKFGCKEKIRKCNIEEHLNKMSVFHADLIKK